MDHTATTLAAARQDGILRGIQKRLADRVRTPFEILLWGDHTYRFGKGEPAVKVFVKHPRGLAALSRMDELGICEAYMDGSLDVAGDMLSFVSLRGLLSDRHPLHSLWRRIAPLFIGRGQTDRQAIA
ncbi:MAG: class I SAM-dependent methyltransferase, partial [Betaproteobacteria bacterium]